jgi:diguanylate cyclase (GGDEF)-like protein
MTSSFLLSRGALLALFLFFLSSLLLAMEFELVATTGPVTPGDKTERVTLEELLTLSGFFSIVLTAVAFLNGKWAARERESRAIIEHVAYFDPLTGLANRRLFNDRFASALSLARQGSACALAMIDLDRFKQINDTMGHAAGDRLLIEIGDRIRQFASNPEDVARLGGDEFAIILRDRSADEAAAKDLVARLESAIGRPFEFEGQEIVPSASIGIAFAREGNARSSELLAAADQLMYADKRRRRAKLAA